MPIYSYECAKCHHKEDRFVPMRERESQLCDQPAPARSEHPDAKCEGALVPEMGVAARMSEQWSRGLR